MSNKLIVPEYSKDDYDIKVKYISSNDRILAEAILQFRDNNTLFIDWIDTFEYGIFKEFIKAIVDYFKPEYISASFAHKKIVDIFKNIFGNPIESGNYNNLPDDYDSYIDNSVPTESFKWKINESFDNTDINEVLKIQEKWQNNPEKYSYREEYFDISKLIPLEEKNSKDDKEKIQEMVDYIKNEEDSWGNISALEYKGKYYILDGHHRTLAYLLAGKPKNYINVYNAEEIINESVEVSDDILDEDLMVFPEELNQKLFDGDKLKPEVREKLIEIGLEFYNSFDLEFELIDLYFEGSLAQYNYVELENINGIAGLNYKSDIDLHLVLDYSKLDLPQDVIDDYFKSKKTIFNEHHNIQVMGFDVEVGNEDVNTPLVVSGCYSLFEDKWIKKPEPITQEVENIRDTEDYAEFRQYVIDAIKSNDIDILEDIWDKIKYMRKQSLKLDGEFGKGNLIFKALRQESLLTILKKALDAKRDEQLSLNEDGSATSAGCIAGFAAPIGIGSKFKAKKGDWKKSAEELNNQIINMMESSETFEASIDNNEITMIMKDDTGVIGSLHATIKGKHITIDWIEAENSDVKHILSSHFYKFLEEELPEHSISQSFDIIVEGYNPQAVMANAELFNDMAEDKGFEIPDDEVSISDVKPKRNDSGKFSIYFNAYKDDDKWKIRVSDHDKNRNYVNDVNIYIVSDTENKELVKNKIEELENVSSRIAQNKEKVLSIIKNSDFAAKFLINYTTNPMWFPALCKDYYINPHYKNYDWFKIALQDKCMELSKISPKLWTSYKETLLYDWRVGEQLKHF